MNTPASHPWISCHCLSLAKCWKLEGKGASGIRSIELNLLIQKAGQRKAENESKWGGAQGESSTVFRSAYAKCCYVQRLNGGSSSCPLVQDFPINTGIPQMCCLVLAALMSSNGEHLLVKFQIKPKIIFSFEVAFLTFQVVLLKMSAYLKIIQAYI